MAFLTGAFFLGACVDRRVSRVDERRRETLITPRGTAFFLGAACAEERVSGGTIRAIERPRSHDNAEAPRSD